MRPTTRTTVAAAAALLLTLTACGTEDEAASAGESGTQAESADNADGAEEAADAEGTAETGSAEDADIAEEDEGRAMPTDLQPARDGLASWLQANRPETPQTSTNIPGCPAISVERVEEAMAEVGYPDITLGGWATEIEWDEYEEVHPDLMGLVCAGDAYGNPNASDLMTASGVTVVDLADLADFESMLPTMGLPGLTVEPAPEHLGGELVATCAMEELCVAFWHSDGLVVGVPLVADGADEDTVEQLLVLLLPDVLATLAEN